MERMKRRSGSEWADILSEWKKSGRSKRGYCRHKGISFSAFGYWRKKLDKQSGETSLVKVNNLLALPGVGGNTLLVKAGGIQVELTGQENEDLLVRIFRALKAAL